MFFKIASIRKNVKLKKSSIVLCILQMLFGLFVIPYYFCVLMLVLNSGVLPNILMVGQYIIYTILIALYWYICNLRKYSHSYMLDYTKATLENRGGRCIRCSSKIKGALKRFDYEEKIGERKIKYSDGYVRYESIMEKRKERLPHYICTGKKCALETKPQKHSAGSYKVRRQVKNNYSFYELPRGLTNTYRLIVGDTNSSCESSVMGKFHTRAHRILMIIVFVVLLIISNNDNYDVTTNALVMLWETKASIIIFAVMTAILVIAYIIAEVAVKIKCDKICSTDDFNQKCRQRGKQLMEVCFTKQNGDYMINYRKEAIWKARKEKDPMVENLPKYNNQGEKKFLKDKQQYVKSLLEMLYLFLDKTKLNYNTNYLNGTYIIESLTDHIVPRKYSFIIDEETGYLAMSTCFFYGLYKEHIQNIVTDWLDENENHNFAIFVDQDPYGMYVSSGIPFTLDYELKDSDKCEFEEVISHYIEWITVLQNIVADAFGEEEDFSERPNISKQLLEEAAKQLQKPI